MPLFNYKRILLSFSYTIFIIFFISTIQNNIWPVIFGIHLPLQLWIPCLVYWVLYRSTASAIFFIYLITINMISLSVISLGCLLGIASFIAFLLIFFKRVYYVNWIFFSTGTAVALLFFPFLLLLFSGWTDGKIYMPHFGPWIGGGLMSWLFSFPLLWIFQRMDQLLNIKLAEQKL